MIFNKILRKINISFVFIYIVIVLIAIAIIDVYVQGVVRTYEISPFYCCKIFWISILSVNILSILILYFTIIDKNYYMYKYIPYFIIIILVSNMLIVSYPFLRDYYLYGGADPIGHLNRVISILKKGLVNSDNFYPLTHLMLSVLSIITGVYPGILFKILPNVVYLIKILLISSIVLRLTNLRNNIAIVLIVTPFLFSYYEIAVYPHYYSLLILLIVIYYLFNWNKIGLFIGLVSLIFYHPYTSFYTIILFSTMILFRSFIYKQNQIKQINRPRIGIIVASIIILWYLWMSNFGFTYEYFRDIIIKLNKAAMEIPRTTEISFVKNLTIKEKIQFVLRLYGGQIIYSLLIIYSMIYLYRKKMLNNNIIIILITYVISMLLLFFTIKQISFGRLFSLGLPYWVYPIILALYLKRNNISSNTIKITKVAIIIVLCLIHVMLVFSMFRSPYVGEPNWHMTYADLAVLTWTQKYKEAIVEGISLGFPVKYLSTTEYYNLPPHFGYPAKSPSDYLPKGMLLIIGDRAIKVAKYDVPFIPSNWGDNINFDVGDFEKLLKDETLGKIYDNKSLWIMRISR